MYRIKMPVMVAITAAAAIAAALGVSVGPAGAAKPAPGGSTSHLALVVETGSDSVPNWGDTVTFDVSTTATSEPHVDLTCSQGGTVVYAATSGFYASYPWPWTQNMNLGSRMWTGGDAACSARLYMFNGKRTNTLAALSFTAYA